MSESFKPMLAADCKGDLRKIKFPVLASPKIDGIRCVIVNGKALTRSLKPIPNKHIREELEALELDGLDGELLVGSTFAETTSAVMSHDGAPDFVFRVFDDFTHPERPFGERFDDADFRTDSCDPNIATLTHQVIGNETDLARYEARCLELGYEGVMLRDPNGLYKFGRSTLKEGGLVKLKRFTDDEAIVTGVVEQMHNGNEAFTDELGRTKRSSAKAGKTGLGVLGALVVNNAHGQTFQIGTGFTANQRAFLWKKRENVIGMIAKYKYLEYGSVDAPRHPVFIGFRSGLDL